MPAIVQISLAALWAAYAPKLKNSGRIPCQVDVIGRGTATHIYRGFGAIRLENITGRPASGRGFQGDEIAYSTIACSNTTTIRIAD